MKFINASSLVGPTRTRTVRVTVILCAIGMALNLAHTYYKYLTVVDLVSSKAKNMNNDNSTNFNNTSARHHVQAVLDNKAVKVNQEATNNTSSINSLILSGAAGTSSLTEESTSSLSCFEKRGMKGHWVQDWDYAKRNAYKIHGSPANWHSASQGFHATSEQPFRLATSWKWQEDDEKCPVHEISLAGFCQACANLDITRIVILGDSMSTEFFYSIIGLLGFSLNERQASYNRMQKPRQISCQAAVPAAQDSLSSEERIRSSSSKQFFITLWMVRRAPLGQLINLRSETKLSDFVENHPNRTAIIANTGAWMIDMGQYALAFQSLLDWFDSFPDPSKIIAFFRPTTPGHVDCLPLGSKTEISTYNWTIPVNDAPYLDYKDYLKSTMEAAPNKTAYNWFIFEAYNAHSQALLQNRTKATAGATLPFNKNNNTNNITNPLLPIHWLNVFNSTMLRCDGHIGGNDCLHYYIPGPTDWWVHFFYSMLVDLAKQADATEGQR